MLKALLAIPVAVLYVEYTLLENVAPAAVTVPGNEVLPLPSNNVAVLVNELNTPVYCLT